MKASKEAGAIGAATVGAGAALTATLAGACCVGPSLAPVLISVVGAGGLIGIISLRPYMPIFLLFSAIMLAVSFRRIYPQVRCSDNAPISRTLKGARLITWFAAFLWLASAVDSIYGLLHE